MKLGDQDKSWAPHIVCKTCLEHLRQWTLGTRKSMRFGIPMIWREPRNHVDDCYFCAINVAGVNRKKRKSLNYPNLQTAIRPVPHCDEIPVPVFKNLPELPTSDFESSFTEPNENAYLETETDADDNDEDFSGPLKVSQKDIQ